jgi:multimeric flavodoxin WrbA
MRVLIINGSYRKDGATEQLVDVVLRTLKARGAETDVLTLRDVEIGFCTNCRACMQQPGEAPGACVIQDAMQGIVQRIEACDALVLASPTNAGSVTAIFRRLIERLVVFGYWPWGAPMPKFRKDAAPKKKAVLISTCGAPGILGRLTFSTQKQLAATAKLVGARACGALFCGLHAQTPVARLSASEIRRAERLAEKLL